MVTLGGRRGEKPPGVPKSLTFAQQLRTPTLYNAIGHAKRLGDVVRFGFSASLWRHFERFETFPNGLLPFGDAICRFNPVYGQDMSVATQEAVLLRRLLEHIANPELAADLHVDTLALIREARIAGDDEEPADAGEGRDDLLDHVISENTPARGVRSYWRRAGLR
jgi:hypothetical protein